MKIYQVMHYINGYKQGYRKFMGYSKREAIKRYREEFNLKHKRVEMMVLDSQNNCVHYLVGK